MYKYFYVTMLIAAILLGIVGLLFGSIGVKYPKTHRSVLNTLVIIVVVAMIGFIVTLM